MNQREKEENEINKFIILVDTREQIPFRFPNTKSQALPYGDYSVEYNGKSYHDKIVIERKGGIGELYAFSGSERDRFCRELEKMKDVKYKYILIEADFLDIVNKQPYGKLPSSTVYSTILSFAIKYQITPLFCNSHQNARQVLWKLFYFFVKYEILNLR